MIVRVRNNCGATNGQDELCREVSAVTAVTLFLADEAATLALGAALGQQTAGHGVIYLEGDLGAGKTTLTRGLLRSLGHAGAVKSPTFTLVEPYEMNGMRAWHFDLYRLSDPEELEFLGIRDYFAADDLCIIEWPQRGAGVLPEPDLRITMRPSGQGRAVLLEPCSARGSDWCRALPAGSNE